MLLDNIDEFMLVRTIYSNISINGRLSHLFNLKEKKKKINLEIMNEAKQTTTINEKWMEEL